jgi:hypothetical protein
MLSKIVLLRPIMFRDPAYRVFKAIEIGNHPALVEEVKECLKGL